MLGGGGKGPFWFVILLATAKLSLSSRTIVAAVLMLPAIYILYIADIHHLKAIHITLPIYALVSDLANQQEDNGKDVRIVRCCRSIQALQQ